MDSELNKYSFGRTLELKPSAYTFVAVVSPYPSYYTVCEYCAFYVLSKVTAVEYLGRLTFKILSISEFDQIPSWIREYYNLSGNQCIPI